MSLAVPGCNGGHDWHHDTQQCLLHTDPFYHCTYTSSTTGAGYQGERAHHNSASPAGVTMHSVLSTNCGFLHRCRRIHGKTLAASIRGKRHNLALLAS